MWLVRATADARTVVASCSAMALIAIQPALMLPEAGAARGVCTRWPQGPTVPPPSVLSFPPSRILLAGAGLPSSTRCFPQDSTPQQVGSPRTAT